MRSKCVSSVALFALASAAACAAPASTTESVGTSAEALSTGGISASYVITGSTPNNYSATVTVQNNSHAPASNWQVAINLNANNVTNLNWDQNRAGVDTINGLKVFSPSPNAGTIQPGGSASFTYSVTMSSGNPAPTIVSVDGMPSGSAAANSPADGVDHIARAAASTALQIVRTYEKDKLANDGDPNYALYDELVWTSQSYRLASDGNTIEFDPNVPGYAFIPNSTKAALAFAQMDPSVASYLTTGLASCFSQTTDTNVYDIRAKFFKGYQYPGSSASQTTSGSGPGQQDTYSAVGSTSNGSELVTIKATTTYDHWFGILVPTSVGSFPGLGSATYSKYTGGNPSACTPFNGPGGSSNPSFIDNGKVISARYLGNGIDCQNPCTDTLTVDPVPYSEPGDYYNTYGLVGPQSNTFSLDPTVLYADPYHQGQWATRFVNGVQQWGTFSTAVTQWGTTRYKYVKMY